MTDFDDSLIDGGITFGRLRRAADLLQNHVIPVFTLDERELLDLEGSGLLARLGNRHYLITAAHVLDACSQDVYIPLGTDNIEPLTGPAIVTGRKPGFTRLDDKIDIGFVRLSHEEAASFEEDRFLNLEHVWGPSLPISTTLFAVLGYPVRNRISQPQTQTIATPLTSFYTGLANEKAYRLTKTDDSSQVLLRYNRRTIATRTGVGSPSDMHGISGGGVWPIDLRVEPNPQFPSLLAGIVIERPREHFASLLVTRGNVIRSFVSRFDDSVAAT